MSIHKEGYTILVITLLCLAGINVLSYFFLAGYPVIKTGTFIFSIVFFLAILQFFRLPVRMVTFNENSILSPADGKVVAIEEVEETEYFKDKRIQVSVFMSPLNVHVNWLPLSGIVKYVKYHPGSYLVAWHPKSSTENERTTLVIEAANQTQVLLRQIAGALAKRIVYYVKEGDQVKQGQQLGFIKFGSRVDLLLPMGVKLNVQLGQKVKGNETVIAEIV